MDDEYVTVYIQGERMPIPVSRKELAKNLRRGAENSRKSSLRPGQILSQSDVSEDVFQTFYTVLAAVEKKGKNYFWPGI